MTRSRWIPWLVLALVLVVALIVGTRADGSPKTLDERTLAIAREVRCPTCESQSSADSNAPASEAIRNEIRDQLEAGRSPGQIRGFLVSRFGSDILLKPRSSGVAGLVWAIPVAVLVLALAGLTFAFRRWKRQSRIVAASDADRLIVDRALAGEDK